MNVAAAPALPASPVADGTVTAVGQAGGKAGGQADAAPTGFDALLALVDAAIDGAPATAQPEVAQPEVAGTGDDADAAANAPSDPMLAALAALMIPAAPLADATAPAAAETAPAAALAVQTNVAATAPDLAALDLAAPDLPAPNAAGPAPAATAEPAPTDVAAPFTLAAAPAAAPAAPVSAAPTPALPAAVPAPVAAGDAVKTEAPARPAAAAPAGEAAAKPAAKAVETQTADAVTAIATGAGKDASDQGMAQAETAAPPAAGAPTATDAASTPTPIRTADTLAPVAEAVAVVRGSPDTVAKLSADILKKLDGRSTRFEIALDPVGLGRVDVKMEIGSNGQVTANLSFDTAHAASELRGRAGELRHALQQAGFDLPENALSFDVGSQAGGDGRGAQTAWDFEGRGQGRGGAFAGRAFEAVLNGGESLVSDLSTRFGAPRADGVDVRI